MIFLKKIMDFFDFFKKLKLNTNRPFNIYRVHNRLKPILTILHVHTTYIVLLFLKLRFTAQYLQPQDLNYLRV